MRGLRFFGGARVMTSREVAELTGKQHKDVLYDIRKMLEELGLTPADFSADLPDAYGRMQPAFALPHRECMILVSGYSIPMRARIVDRWEALESGKVKPAMVQAEEKPSVSFIENEAAAALRIAQNEALKLAFPLLWQEIQDATQNALRRSIGSVAALPAPEAAHPLDVVEIAKREGVELPANLRSAAGRYVKARVTGVKTERLINGSIRESTAYTDHKAVAEALREYLSKRK